MYIDTHAHYDIILEDKSIDENDLIASIAESGIGYSVQVAIDNSGFAWAEEFSSRHAPQGVYFTAGIHPSSQALEDDLKGLEMFVDAVSKRESFARLFGIGECGLDFYRMRQPAESQKASFARQIDLAGKYNLPVIVHSRNAMDDTIDLLKSEKAGGGIFHCFPGGMQDAKKALDLGFYISYAGNVTYASARELHESSAYVPLDRILIETDSPFLSPVPLRGTQNRPENIIHTYKFIADLKKITVDDLKKAAEENFLRIVSGD